MSEITNTPLDRNTTRRQLLSTVSAVALIGSVYGIGCANAASNDEDRPTLWIEFGGQAQAITGQGELFTAPFMATYADSAIFKPLSPTKAQKPPAFSFGENGKISFQPEGSDWVLSASILIGRSADHRNIHQQTFQKIPSSIPLSTIATVYAPSLVINNYAQYLVQHNESHAILDFQVGRDVGLGLFGNHGRSQFNAGVRMAQFSNSMTADINVRPDVTLHGIHKYYDNFALAGRSARSFHGIGPSLSWNASAALTGDTDGELTVDWGVNAAFLFGRQRTKLHHQTTATYRHRDKYNLPVRYQYSKDSQRSRTVTVPNFGGFAGVSYRFARGAISLGYRADFFLGAIDGGIDTAEKSTLGFHGPFATVSIGVGG